MVELHLAFANSGVKRVRPVLAVPHGIETWDVADRFGDCGGPVARSADWVAKALGRENFRGGNTMPQTCTICKNPNREAIEAELLGTESLRTIAVRWSVSKSALLRHKAGHLPAAIVKATAAKEEIHGGKLLQRLTELNGETTLILREARTASTKDNQLALKAIARVERQLLLEGQLLAEMKEDPAVDLTLAPEWQNLRAAILLALQPHPAARAAVLKALESQEVVNNVVAA